MGESHAYLVFKDLGSLANKLWTRRADHASYIAKDKNGPIAQLARAHP